MNLSIGQLGNWLMAAAFVVALGLAASMARAATANGNDFALGYSEAKTPAAKKAVLEAARGNPHFFRYLQILDAREVTEEGQKGVRITAFEPGSYLRVKFTVTSAISLGLLQQEPVSKVGTAIAVTGRVAEVEPGAEGAILLESPIVRQKDRLSPKVGKELLSETNPTAVIYSYTEGPRPVLLEARDRDLLAFRDEKLAAGGPKGWVEFLEGELAKRKQQRAAGGGSR